MSDGEVHPIVPTCSGQSPVFALRLRRASCLTVSYENGASTATHPITWAATNLLVHDSLVIRQGDSLRLTAYDPSAVPSGTFILGGETTLSLPSVPQTSAEPVAYLFDTPGTHTLTATWTPEEGEAQTSTLTIHVRAADFGPAFIVQTWNRRTWTLTGVQGADVEADSSLYWHETTQPTDSTRSFLVNAFTAQNTHVIARVPETGEILAHGTVNAFSLAGATETADSQLVETRPDGSSLYRFTLVGENLPSNFELNMFSYYQGTIFTNGSRYLILNSSDFSSNGVANVRMETSSVPPRLCHFITTYLTN